MSNDDDVERVPFRRRPIVVTIDLPGVLIVLLMASFVLMSLTIVYGLIAQELEPAIVLTIVGTVFSGVLAGALATWREQNKKQSEERK